MSYLLDDVARTLACPTTARRQALKLLSGHWPGGILGAVGITGCCVPCISGARVWHCAVRRQRHE
jgi:hypothetical protein